MAANYENLSGKVAVITGATSGIGLAVAQALHSRGMKLVLNGRNREKLDGLENSLSATTLPGDVTESGLPGELLKLALSEYGRCDVLLNNAGFMETGPVESIDIERICEMVRVNVEGAFRFAYTFCRYFQERGSGHLVNVSSILGTKVRPMAGAYAGTKYAVEALSEALRMELAGTGVQVSCIEPGLVITGLHDHLEVHPAKTLNIKDPLQPVDVAKCVLFLITQPPHVRIPKMMVLPGEQKL